mgnify:CR=1 FL=1
MGIRGFMTLIESRLSHYGDESTVLERGSVFCVDGTTVRAKAEERYYVTCLDYHIE